MLCQYQKEIQMFCNENDIRYLLKMIKQHSPLIGNATRSDHRIPEDIECDLTAKVIRHLKYH